MRRILLLGAFAILASSPACNSSEPEDKGPQTKVTKENIDKAKDGLKLPMPAVDAKKQISEVLGEATSTDGENLVWAGISGDQCNELTLVVSKGTANGTIGGSAHRIVGDEFKKCATKAGK